MVMGDVEDIAHDVQVDVHDEEFTSSKTLYLKTLTRGSRTSGQCPPGGGKKKIFCSIIPLENSLVQENNSLV